MLLDMFTNTLPPPAVNALTPKPDPEIVPVSVTEMLALLAAFAIPTLIPTPLLPVMLPLMLTVRSPLVAVAVFCSLMALIPCASPVPITLMLPVLLDVATTPSTPVTLPLNVIVVLPLPPVTTELIPAPPVEVMFAPGMVVTATLPPLLLMLTPSPPVFVIGFGPVAEMTFRSTLNPPAPPEMMTPPVVTVSLLNRTSRLPVAVLATEASVPEQTETPVVFASHAACAGTTPPSIAHANTAPAKIDQFLGLDPLCICPFVTRFGPLPGHGRVMLETSLTPENKSQPYTNHSHTMCESTRVLPRCNTLKRPRAGMFREAAGTLAAAGPQRPLHAARGSPAPSPWVGIGLATWALWGLHRVWIVTLSENIQFG